MKCDICKNSEATIHIQEVINNNIKSLHLCEKCAKTYGFNNELIDIGFHLMGFLHDFKPLKVNQNNGTPLETTFKKNKQIFFEDENIIKCSQCNTTYNEFLETGKFGCAFCYIAFKEQIKPLIRRIHGKVNHKGHGPEKYKKQLKLMRDVRVLNQRLKRAVKKEDFETAADIRDKIKSTKKFPEKGNDRI